MGPRDLLMRQAFRVGYRLVQVWGTLAPRSESRGVKCVLTHDGELLLVRHTYGPRRWHVPGGGMRRGETPAAAAARETEEELGLTGLAWSDLGVVRVRLDRRMARMACQCAETPGRSVSPQPAEIADARWFAPDALPASLGEEVPEVVIRLRQWRAGKVG